MSFGDDSRDQTLTAPLVMYVLGELCLSATLTLTWRQIHCVHTNRCCCCCKVNQSILSLWWTQIYPKARSIAVALISLCLSIFLSCERKKWLSFLFIQLLGSFALVVSTPSCDVSAQWDLSILVAKALAKTETLSLPFLCCVCSMVLGSWISIFILVMLSLPSCSFHAVWLQRWDCRVCIRGLIHLASCSFASRSATLGPYLTPAQIYISNWP